MNRTLTVILFCLVGLKAFSQVSDQPRPLLESEEFAKAKDAYRECVLEKGVQLMAVTDFDTAMRYGPLVCRRGLLQIKRYMLDSAFKVDVMNGLIASIAEGVEIDLANHLLEEKLRLSAEEE